MRGVPGGRRLTAWDDTFFDLVVASGATSSVALVNNVADPEKRGCTLVRMILDFEFIASAPGVFSGVQRVSAGIMVVSDDAFVGNVMPNPEDASDYPVGGWLWRTQKQVRDETNATGPVPRIGMEKDLRAMRKLDRAQLVLTVHNESVEGSSFTVGFVGLIRCLYKLP